MKEYNVLQYGAVGDGTTNDAFAIQHAIDDCAKNGGGRVVAAKRLCVLQRLHSPAIQCGPAYSKRRSTESHRQY